MHPGADPLGAPPSFSQRRSATSQLPNFTLPQPQLSSFNAAKYSTFSTSTTQSPMNHNGLASVGNLLTPPNTLPGDCNPLSPGAQSNASSVNSNIQNYPQNNYWSQPAQQAQYGPYNGPQGSQQQTGQQHHQHQQQQQPQQQQSWAASRNPYSTSSLNGIVRDGSTSQSHQSQSDYNQLPPFSQTMSAPAALPTMTEQSQYSAHTSPVSSQEPFHMRQQYGANQFSGTSQGSPISTSSHQSRLSPLSSGHDLTSGYQRPYAPYPLPHANGTIMPGMHHQGQMSMVSPMSNGLISPGFGGNHASGLHNMYSLPHAQQVQPANDRPFKCDQCNQSFNRNHDLKRHKRIHLAVKPYPCGHCDKSFSRKDALKRHILVKGCGKGLMVEETEKRSESSSASPISNRSDHGHLGSPPLSGQR